MDTIRQYLEEARQILQQVNLRDVEAVLDLLVQVQHRKGRVFFLGVGGGAGHASHAVNDFRKGETVRVKVLNVDVDTERISLGSTPSTRAMQSAICAA